MPLLIFLFFFRFITFPNGLRYPRWSPQPTYSSQYSAYPQTAFPNAFNVQNLQTNVPIINQSNLSAKRNEAVRVSPKEEISVAKLLKERQKLTNQNESLAPYRAHPLFHYLKNRNTVDRDKIISFRNDNPSTNEKITTLILKPVAKAVAGIEGKAISTPLSRAILRQGTNVDILFEPEAVAVVGPGGIAHAQSDLEISYEDLMES